MRVFVVGTGRCGSSTFYQACKTITNYTCGHETFAGQVHNFDYPDNHVEVAVQNVQALALLRKKYPSSRFVHLIRGKEHCVRSLVKQIPEYLRAWASQIFLHHDALPSEYLAGIYYDCINEAIVRFSCSICITDFQQIHIQQIKEHWKYFLKFINADCNLEEVQHVLSRKYNPGINRGRDNYVEI